MIELLTLLFVTGGSVFFASIPMLTFLTAVWWLDRYDREPVWLFGLTFLWGAIGAVLFALVFSPIVELPLLWIAPSSLDSAMGPVIVAPFVEEPSKALFLMFVIWNRHFDNMTDGFVYGAAAGLGFGMTENFMYFISAGMSGDVFGWMGTVVIRTLYSAVMHATATSVVGAAIGMVRFRGCLAMLVLGPLGLGVAETIHMLWNGLLTAEELFPANGMLALANLALFPLEVLLIFSVFQVSLLVESSRIRRELRDEVAEGRLPEGHDRVAASWFRRAFTRSWVPEGVRARPYLETLTTLAHRKHQARVTGSRFYKDEVQRLQRKLSRMLGQEPG